MHRKPALWQWLAWLIGLVSCAAGVLLDPVHWVTYAPPAVLIAATLGINLYLLARRE